MINYKIKAGIIGYGRSGQLLHGAGLLANASFEVVAVCSQSESSLQKAGEDFQCPVYTDYRLMLSEAELDLVVIVTRNDQHADMACDCLEAGAHVLVTKPLGVSFEEVTRIRDTSLKTGKTVYPYLPSRWGSDLRAIREIVDSGEIGQVFCIRRAAYGFATRDDWQTETRFGGGILLNWGPHLLDTAMVLAKSRVQSVYGHCGRVLNPGDAEDHFNASLQMSNGVQVMCEWTFLADGLPNWVVQGTRGCIKAFGQDLHIYSGEPVKPGDPTDSKAMEGNGVDHRVLTVGEHIYGDPVEIYGDLASAVQGETSFPVTVEDALELAGVIDQIKQSSENQEVIRRS